MNERVQQLLEQRKKQIRSEEVERRNRHLIDIGLYEVKDEIVWSKKWDGSPGWEYDKEKDSYSKVMSSQKNALVVTDEEYEEICKLFPEDSAPKVKEQVNRRAENTLRTIANILLIVGVIACVVIIILAFSSVSPAVALAAVPYLLLVLATWALLRCFADISITLKEIKQKM